VARGLAAAAWGLHCRSLDTIFFGVAKFVERGGRCGGCINQHSTYEQPT